MPLRALEPNDGPTVTGIDQAACLALLGVGGIGRVAVSIAAVPAVFPVNYAILDGDVVLRAPGVTNFDAALRDAVVAFEVDDVDPLYNEEWSVLVVGTASEITDDVRRSRAEQLLMRPWSEGAKEHVMAIRPELVSGRRLVRTPVCAEAHRGAALRP